MRLISSVLFESLQPRLSFDYGRYCKRLSALSRDTKRLAARTRFMLQDLLECRRNGWKERRAKDGPHKIGPTKSNTMQQNMQHRRDQERSMARERQRQTLSQQQQQQ